MAYRHKTNLWILIFTILSSKIKYIRIAYSSEFGQGFTCMYVINRKAITIICIYIYQLLHTKYHHTANHYQTHLTHTYNFILVDKPLADKKIIFMI